jgi:hypothetical protein
MPESREPTTEQAALVVSQAHWLAERYEANAEGFLTRAGIFLGLLGVEAAVIAPAQAALWSRLVALGLLVAPGTLLLMVFRRYEVAYPSHEELASAILGTAHPTWLIVEQTLKVFDPARSLTAQLKAEAERRYFWCTWGLYVLIGVQPLVAIALVIGVWS